MCSQSKNFIFNGLYFIYINQESIISYPDCMKGEMKSTKQNSN